MIPLQTLQLVCCAKKKRMPSKVDVWLAQPLEPSEDSLLDFHDVFSSDNSFSLLDYMSDSYDTADPLKTVTTLSFEQNNNIMRYDCMWTGCDEDCRKKHSISSPVLDFDNLAVLPGRLSCSSVDFENYNENTITNSAAIIPYTPGNDHCYSQPQHLQAPQVNCNAVDSVEDSDTGSESSDEVDVVTVSDECGFLVGQKFIPQIRRTTRQQNLIRKPNVKSRNTSRTERTVKAAASALKRTRFQPRTTIKRRKTMNSVETSPSSSLPSSCGTSRCNSDVEDYEKRHTHNDSERKRREQQRSALNLLRTAIPELKDNSKAPKVLILNTASKLVRKLELEAEANKELKKREMKRRKKLQSKLNALKHTTNFY